MSFVSKFDISDNSEIKEKFNFKNQRSNCLKKFFSKNYKDRKNNYEVSSPKRRFKIRNREIIKNSETDFEQKNPEEKAVKVFNVNKRRKTQSLMDQRRSLDSLTIRRKIKLEKNFTKYVEENEKKS